MTADGAQYNILVLRFCYFEPRPAHAPHGQDNQFDAACIGAAILHG